MSNCESDLAHFDWPFFDEKHREFAKELENWAQSNLHDVDAPSCANVDEVDEICRTLVRRLGKSGFLNRCVPSINSRGEPEIDTRSVCIAREILARHNGLADFAFAMQGLGSGAISLQGSETLKARVLDPVASGRSIAAFALSEPQAGSDVSAMQCTAERSGDSFILNGEKMWISNGGIADFYVVFAREPGSSRSSGISAFFVEATTPGLEIAERLNVIAPHPLAKLRFDQCVIPAANLIGVIGGGFKLAMKTLDIFRTSVGAAALGFARKALNNGIDRAINRAMFESTLADTQLTKVKLSEMALAVDSSSLLIYRAAWMRDGGKNITREAAMAKLMATESAQRVIDSAVQLWGGEGVQTGSTVERLYREIRALRIYEGATEVQQLIIGSDIVKKARSIQAEQNTN